MRVPYGHTWLDRLKYFRNTLIRICDCCTYQRDIYQSAVLVAIELLANKWPKVDICITLTVVAGQRKNEGEGLAMNAAKQMLEWML